MTIDINQNSFFYLLNTNNTNYPVGSFVYSHGLEYLIEEEIIKSPKEFIQYVEHLFFDSHYKQDIIFFNEIFLRKKITNKKILDLINYYKSFNSSEELLNETLNVGSSYFKITSKIYKLENKTKFLNQYDKPFCIMYSLFSRLLGIKFEDSLKGFIYSNLNNLVSSYVKIKPSGQEEGQMFLKEIFSKFEKKISFFKSLNLNDLDSFNFYADISSFKHEKMYTRIYQS